MLILNIINGFQHLLWHLVLVFKHENKIFILSNPIEKRCDLPSFYLEFLVNFKLYLLDLVLEFFNQLVFYVILDFVVFAKINLRVIFGVARVFVKMVWSAIALTILLRYWVFVRRFRIFVEVVVCCQFYLRCLDVYMLLC